MKTLHQENNGTNYNNARLLFLKKIGKEIKKSDKKLIYFLENKINNEELEKEHIYNKILKEEFIYASNRIDFK